MGLFAFCGVATARMQRGEGERSPQHTRHGKLCAGGLQPRVDGERASRFCVLLSVPPDGVIAPLAKMLPLLFGWRNSQPESHHRHPANAKVNSQHLDQ